MSNPGFSLQRVEMLWDFYQPRTLRQVGLSVLVIIIAYLFMAVSCRIESYYLYSFGTNILTLPIYFSPLLFATYKNREIFVQIPATYIEKGVFLIGYSLVFIPLSVFIAWVSIEAIGSLCGIAHDVTTHFDHYLQPLGVPGIFNTASVLGESVPIIVSLYVILSCRTHRVVKGILSSFATILGMGIINVFYGVYILIQAIPEIERNQGHLPEDCFNELIRNSMPGYMFYYSLISIVLLIIGIVTVGQKIKRIQV